jgi:hypothetical protein
LLVAADKLFGHTPYVNTIKFILNILGPHATYAAFGAQWYDIVGFEIDAPNELSYVAEFRLWRIYHFGIP